MIFYGKNPFFEALYQNRILKAYIRKNDKVKDTLVQKKIPYEELLPEKHKEKFGRDSQGYAFEFEPEYKDIEDLIINKKNACILDHIQDPHNFGAIIRAGHCFGVNDFVLAKDNQVQVTPAVVKSSAGAAVYCRFYSVVNVGRTIEELKKNGFWIYAADINGKEELGGITPNEPYVIVIGSEGDGVRKNILNKSDVIFRIPMSAKIDSLNASQSAAISFYQFFINKK